MSMIYFISSYAITVAISVLIGIKTKACEKVWTAVERKISVGYHTALFMTVYVIFSLAVFIIISMITGVEDKVSTEVVKGISTGIGMVFFPSLRNK